MKFWKSLSNLIEETLPDWRDKFLSYKDLKKQLKMIFPPKEEEEEEQECSSRPNKRQRITAGQSDCGGGETEEDAVVTKEVIDFVKLLEEEINKFNVFFLDQQEEYIIRLEVLQDRVEESKDSILEMMKVGREIVDFHGEMVLLENYSALNYTGLVKILKKYDKLSGALIRLPFIQKVLQEPFFKTDVLNELVEKCVSMLDQYFPMNEQSAPSVATNEEESCGANTNTETKETLKVPQELAEIENMENKYLRHTLSALRVLKQIRSGSSTVSAFSLPPLQNEVGDVWKKTTVFEQAARSS